MECAFHRSGRCRSCTELPVPYATQLAEKERAVRASLHRAGVTLTSLPVIPSAERAFRNKAKMVVAGTVEHPILGILDAHQAGVDLTECPLYPEEISRAFAPIRAFLVRARIVPYDVPRRRGELKHILLTRDTGGGLLLRFVLRTDESVPRLRKHLSSLRAELPALRVASVNLQPEHNAILEGDEEILLTEERWVTMELNGVAVLLPPKAFFQTNTEVAAALYAQVGAWTAQLGPNRVWDLYCGVGGFALHAAAHAGEVLGIERSDEAVDCANRSATLSSVENARFVAGDVLERTRAVPSTELPDLVIVNPPRRGVGEELAQLLDRSTATEIFYSSCNVDSFVRDLASMPSLQVDEARLFDMFPHTRHHEVLIRLTRRRGWTVARP